MTAPFGVYIHVPFCASRCGYCDFNTYTPGELGNPNSPEEYLKALRAELTMAAGGGRVGVGPGEGILGGGPADTIFIGGGTPSMLGTRLVEILSYIRDTFGIAPGAEITTEANPESTSPEFFEALRAGGFTRISLGMQSAAPHVLRVLERRHTPGRALAAAAEAQAAGFNHINLDMIYGTPGETNEDVEATLEAILSTNVDHVSAYSLIVEDGTAMARKVRRGEIPNPDEDVLAERYNIIDARLREAGFEWYEVSNWAKPGGECQHNLGYWRDGNWWGAGPGAHSHIDHTRFYNVKHPARYTALCMGDELPIQETETLTAADRRIERIMLGMRLREGLPIEMFGQGALAVVKQYCDQGLLLHHGDAIALAPKGRLLADGIITDIIIGDEKEGR
ncbi:radical SAM family heme chaperone HemW [Corynebacterium freiburgense]|uniref:radical SAM family heme chaperone HemW n=1 Tax=Corynebacterium freiburgense TaxID=556548 RepID=UPI0003FEEAFF|nr:radical SAM family heme chaperone HemW [Corynebacterium freiburgense]WJZ03312.1 Oxygen-independent coproporphyrinogen-III oxidase 1 [Corynebacterium freiburgense]